MIELHWVKSSYSTATSGNCVEIAALPDGDRAVRDSKDPDGTVLVITARQWRELAGNLLRITRRVAPGGRSGGFLLPRLPDLPGHFRRFSAVASRHRGRPAQRRWHAVTTRSPAPRAGPTRAGAARRAWTAGITPAPAVRHGARTRLAPGVVLRKIRSGLIRR